MPWQEVSIVEQRREFVRLVMRGVNRGTGAQGAGCSSGLGGAQDRALSRARRRAAAGGLDCAPHPGAAWAHPGAGRRTRACQRFEKEAPNLLWQMDFNRPIRLSAAPAGYFSQHVYDRRKPAAIASSSVQNQRLTLCVR